jgi:uncharacterized protein involved in tellurium resistance
MNQTSAQRLILIYAAIVQGANSYAKRKAMIIFTIPDDDFTTGRG